MTAGKLPGWLKPVNKVMLAMQKLGVTAGPVSVLTVPGRKSGRPRSTPMTPFGYDGGMHGVAFPGADWASNARAAGIGTLTRGRRSQRVQIVELSADDARPVLRAFHAQVPTGVGFMKRAGLAPNGTPEEIEALAGRCAVFRFEPLPK
ncbi:nitroreductase/quinone reductase family protein [[Mycobacterium] kokjensenii]|uniref:Nitroreductase/quinone reductase family protein n=1 Tax=[Mycobacterium] kokjensenii TaxID=3064287 RepID=A0ABN9MUT2_9MYCO|nr:deazaflavin-dependent nitroreductase [Mycolicibacter sp. MU0083]CAJ1493796.1 nitroreductase/quinone reductase family protein [Mycolicibacter sp. MU0083]